MSDEPEDDGGEYDDRPSKSERKRNAHDAQKLGEQLIELKNLDLRAFGLPEPLFDAIMEARRITSRTGLVRQRQYVGKLMRGVDLDPIRAALTSRSEHAARDTQQFKRVEHWRDRLITEGAPALDELMQWRTGMDRAEWQRRIAAATAERERTGASGAASRDLFRALRALLDRATIDPQ
jgi:ribosome-associated protein